MPLCSLFRGGILNVSDPDDVELSDVIDEIKSDAWRDTVARLRWNRWEEDDKKEAERLKKSLDYMCPAGTFSTRSRAGLLQASAVFPCDVDNMESLECAEQLRDELCGDKHIVFAYVSPSGRGVKFGMRVGYPKAPQDCDADAWETCDRYTREHYQYSLDASGKDISRAAFLSFDRGAWYNGKALPLQVEIRERQDTALAPADASSIDPGHRHDDLLRVSASLVARGFSADEVRGLLLQRVRRYDRSDGREFGDKEIDDAIQGAIAKFETIPGAREGDLRAGAEWTGKLFTAIPTDADEVARWNDPGPISAELYNGLCGVGEEWHRWLMDTSLYPQPDLGLGAILVASGVVIGRRWAGPWDTRANLYGIGVAGTGEGKEAARKSVMKLFAAGRIDNLLGSQDPKSDSAIVNALSKEPAQIQMIDEAGYLFAAANNRNSSAHVSNIIKILLQLYTSSSVTFTASTYADEKANKRLESPHLGLWLTSTPGKLWGSLTSEALDGGLLGRSLLFSGPSEKPPANRPRAVPPPARLVASVQQTYEGVGDLRARGASGDAEEMPTTAGAWDELDIRREEIDGYQRKHANDPIAALWARVTEQSIKVAMIRAWWRSPLSPQIDRADMQWGFSLVRHCMLRLASNLRHVSDDGSAFGQLRARVLKTIVRSHSGATRSAIMRSTKAESSACDRVLDSLEQAGEIERKAPGDIEAAAGRKVRWIAK